MVQEAFLTILIKAAVLVFVVVTAFDYLVLLERKLGDKRPKRAMVCSYAGNFPTPGRRSC